MKIDILSDIHLDSHMKHLAPTEAFVKTFWDHFEPSGDILIVAGDIGHSNIQNINFLTQLKKLYYKEIICVLGNHDCFDMSTRVIYLYDENGKAIPQPSLTSKARMKEMKQLCSENEIILLDGNIIEIEGLKIGGTMGWYDGEYAKHHQLVEPLHDMTPAWDDATPDAYHLTHEDGKNCTNFKVFLDEELEKIDAIVDHCDIMISHVSPSILKEHQPTLFRDNVGTSFFCFKGEEYLDRFKGSYWIFGHSHQNSSWEITNNHGSFELLTNCLGYNGEYLHKHMPKIKTIDSKEVNTSI